jgi:hypothetical protein
MYSLVPSCLGQCKTSLPLEAKPISPDSQFHHPRCIGSRYENRERFTRKRSWWESISEKLKEARVSKSPHSRREGSKNRRCQHSQLLRFIQFHLCTIIRAHIELYTKEPRWRTPMNAFSYSSRADPLVPSTRSPYFGISVWIRFPVLDESSVSTLPLGTRLSIRLPRLRAALHGSPLPAARRAVSVDSTVPLVTARLRKWPEWCERIDQADSAGLEVCAIVSWNNHGRDATERQLPEGGERQHERHGDAQRGKETPCWLVPPSV